MKSKLFLHLLLLLLLLAVQTACQPAYEANPQILLTPTSPIPTEQSQVETLLPSPDPIETSIPAALCPETTLNPIAFLPDNQRLLAGTTTYTESGVRSGVHIFNLETRQAELSLQLPVPVMNSALSPDGTLLALGLEDNKIQLVTLSDGKVQHTLTGHEAMITALLFSANGERLYSASHDTLVRIWDREGSLLAEFQPSGADGIPREVIGIGISADGSRLAAIPLEGAASLWDLESLEKIAEFEGSISGGYEGATAVFSPDGEYLAVGLGGGGSISLWRLANGELLWQGGGMALAYSPDGLYFAHSDFGEAGKSIVVLRSVDGQDQMLILEGELFFIHRLIFSPDGSKLSATDGTLLRTWQVENGTNLSGIRFLCVEGESQLRFETADQCCPYRKDQP